MNDQSTNLITLAAENATTPRDIEALILNIVATGTPEQVGQARSRVKWINEQARNLSKLFESAVIERLTTSGESEIVVSPDCRLYLGNPPKHAVLPGKAGALVDQLLAISGGDFDTMADRYLVRGWFKQGAIRSAFEEAGVTDTFIETTRTPTVEEGKLKPAKNLLEANPNFDLRRNVA